MRFTETASPSRRPYIASLAQVIVAAAVASMVALGCAGTRTAPASSAPPPAPTASPKAAATAAPTPTAAHAGASDRGPDLGSVSVAAAESLPLGPGAVVWMHAPALAFVMNPDGGLDSIDAASGRRIFHTAEAFYPVLVRDGELLALGGGGLVVLDARTGTRRGTVTVPAAVGSLEVGEGLGTRSTLAGLELPDGDFVISTHATWYAGGAAPRVMSKGTFTETVFRVDVKHRTAAMVPGRDDPGGKIAISWPEVLPLATTPEGLRRSVAFSAGDGVVAILEQSTAGVVLQRTKDGSALPDLAQPGGGAWASVSVDQRDVLFVHSTPATPGWAWSVVHIASGKTFLSGEGPAPGAPILVIGERLLLRTGNPSLDAWGPDGTRAWSHPIRDLRYRGPYPP